MSRPSKFRGSENAAQQQGTVFNSDGKCLNPPAASQTYSHLSVVSPGKCRRQCRGRGHLSSDCELRLCLTCQDRWRSRSTDESRREEEKHFICFISRMSNYYLCRCRLLFSCVRRTSWWIFWREKCKGPLSALQTPPSSRRYVKTVEARLPVTAAPPVCRRVSHAS